MNSRVAFGAPWGTSLKYITGLCVLVLVGIPLFSIIMCDLNKGWVLGIVVLMPLAILLVSLPFIIRGYIVTDDALLIRRLGWHSRIELSNLLSATVDPQAMAKSIRTCGNGGLFCYAGSFHNKKLGSYRAFATAPKLSVVLEFENRTIVVTPDEPEDFVAKII